MTQIAAIAQLEEELKERRARLIEVETKMKKLDPLSKKYASLKHEVDVKTRELENVRERLSHTDHHRLAEEMKALKTETNTLKNDVEEAKRVEAEATKKLKEIDYKIKNAKAIKEKELKVT